MGMVPFAPTARIAKESGALWATFDLAFHSMEADGEFRSGASVTMLCKAWGETARKMVDKVPAKTFVLVRGHLAVDSYRSNTIKLLEMRAGMSPKKSTRGVINLHVTMARVIRKPAETTKTIRLNRDEYHRLKALEKHFDPDGAWLDPEIQKRYALDEEELDDLTTEGI